MKILSIDVGIVNLAYCIMDKEKKVYHWEVFSLCNGTALENEMDLVKKMDERPHLLDIDIILLEKQPKMNPKMKVMAAALRSYFIIRMIDKEKKYKIKDYSSKHKLNCYDGPIPEELIITEEMQRNARSDKKLKGRLYRIRKKLGIYHCEEFMKDNPKEIQDIYTGSQSKKDDLADCYLQVLSYLLFEDSKKKSDVVIKRKPTKRQIKYNKYSKNNLKFLIIEFLSKQIYENNKGLEEFMDIPKKNINLDEMLEEWKEKKEIKKNINQLYNLSENVIQDIKKDLVPEQFWDKQYKKML